jgi:hypothetical protein
VITNYPFIFLLFNNFKIYPLFFRLRNYP